LNKTNAVHQLKILNVKYYAVSRSVVKSKHMRRYTWGGAGMGRTHEVRVGPWFFLLLFWAKPKK